MTRWVQLAFVAGLCIACGPINGCPESRFELASDSRLPQWFAVPAGMTRADVTVRLTYYSKFDNSDDTYFELLDRARNVITRVSGKTRTHQETDKRRNEFGGFDPGSHPRYQIATVNGVSEILEHMPEPRFWISDHPKLRSEAGLPAR